MQTQFAPVVEYALTKDAGAQTPSDDAAKITVALSQSTVLTINRASVEIKPRLSADAMARLKRHSATKVILEIGDGARGFGTERYDAIVLTGSTPVLPDSWLEQIKPGGRLFAVVGDAPAMKARLVRWTAPGAVASEDLFETVIAPLKNAVQPRRFVF